MQFCAGDELNQTALKNSPCEKQWHVWDAIHLERTHTKKNYFGLISQQQSHHAINSSYEQILEYSPYKMHSIIQSKKVAFIHATHTKNTHTHTHTLALTQRWKKAVKPTILMYCLLHLSLFGRCAQ